MKSIFKVILTSYFIFFTSYFLNAQIAINEDGASPDSSAMLDVTSTDKGFLTPRMTTAEREAISSPATGLMVFDTDENSFWYYNGSIWVAFSNLQYNTDTFSPTFQNSISLNNPVDMELSGNYLYILDDGDNQVSVYDVSVAASPTLVSSLSISNELHDMTIDGAYLYVVRDNATNEFSVIDISDPTNISLVGDFDFGSEGTTIAISGDYAYYFDKGDEKLCVIDISTPSVPAYITDITINIDADSDEGIVIDGDYLYIAYKYTSSNLSIVDISTPASPSITGSLFINNNFVCTGLTKHDNYLYISSDYGIRTIDVSTPSNPSTVTNNFSVEIVNHTISGSYLFGDNTFSDNKINVYDINTASSVSLSYTTNKNATGAANDMIAFNGYLYMAENSGDIDIYLFSNTNASTINTYELDGTVSSASIYDYDDLGNHTATENVLLNDNWLSNDGGSEGISINDDGKVALSNNLKLANNWLSNDGGSEGISIADDGKITFSDNLLLNSNWLSNDGDDEGISIADDGKITFSDNLLLNSNWLSNDGDDEGISIADDGKVTFSDNLLLNSNWLSNDGDDEGISINNNGIISFSNNLKLDDNWLSNDGDSEGISITDGGKVAFSNNLKLEGNWLSNDGNNEGISIADDGSTTLSGTLTIGNSYTLPKNDGSANEYLVTDGNGVLSWSDVIDLSGDIAIGVASSGTESTFQNNSSATNDGYLTTPWIYTNAIEATGERDAGSTAITLGNDGNFGADDEIHLITNGSSALIVNSSQHVGIGTNPTNAVLEINGQGSTHSISSIGYLNTSGSGTGNYNGEFSIYADDRIGAYAFIAHSDERIKVIQGKSNSKNDLELLNQIEITNYKMKDSLRYTNQSHKKVIAQQVAEVYPQAVTQTVIQVVPNIYQRATIDENGWINLATDLKTGDKVQIIFEDKKELLEVLEIKENTFRVETLRCNVSTDSEIFVYGKQVDDFHTVDYEAISMLNVSATQELAKKVEILEKENQQLKTQLNKVNQLEQQNAEMKAMLEQIQAQLNNQNQ